MSFANKAFQTVEELLFRHRAAMFWAAFAVAAHMRFRKSAVSFAESAELHHMMSDALINYADGLVRRGLIGEISITLSRWFAGHPWIWAWFLTTAAAGLFFLLAIRLMRRLPEDPGAMPLVLAPWGLLFIAYDNDSFRNEVFGYLAIAAVLQGVISGSKGAARMWSAAGAVVFPISIFMHEIVVFLLPALMLAFILAARRWPEDQKWFAACAAAGMTLGIAIFGVLATLPAPDLALLCAAARISCVPLPPDPFVWLAKGASDAVSFVINSHGWKDMLVYMSIALIALAPMLGFRVPSLSPRSRMAVMLVPTICAAPLFAVGIDWGRWIQMILLPLALIGIAAAAAGFAEYRRLLPHWAAVAYVATWSMSHVSAEYDFKGIYLLPVLGMVLAASFAWSKFRVVH